MLKTAEILSAIDKGNPLQRKLFTLTKPPEMERVDDRERAERLIQSYGDVLDAVRAVDDPEQLETRGRDTVGNLLRTRAQTEFFWAACSDCEWKTRLADRKANYDEATETLLEDDAYVEQARKELTDTLDDMSTTVAYFLELDPISLEVPNAVDFRDHVQALFEALQRVSELHDERIRLEALDEVLETRYRSGVDTIILDCPTVERRWYPERYWWRHPRRIKTEKDA